MSLLKFIELRLVFAFMISLVAAIPLSPAPHPPQAGPWTISGTVSAADSTTPDFSSLSVEFVMNGGHSFATLTGGGSYSAGPFSDGASGTGAASVNGYFVDQETLPAIHNNIQINFPVYSVRAWLSGNVTDALTGAAITNGLGVTAAVAGSSGTNAILTSNSFNFGGTPGHPSVVGGLGVSRDPSLLQGPG